MGKKLQENTKHGRISAPRSEHTYSPSLELSWMISRAQQHKTLHVQVSYNSAKTLYGDQKSVDSYRPRELLKMHCQKYKLCINLLLNQLTFGQQHLMTRGLGSSRKTEALPSTLRLI